jgi:hypothetical protein
MRKYSTIKGRFAIYDIDVYCHGCERRHIMTAIISGRSPPSRGRALAVFALAVLAVGGDAGNARGVLAVASTKSSLERDSPPQAAGDHQRMAVFVDDLLGRMTVREKIGQTL